MDSHTGTAEGSLPLLQSRGLHEWQHGSSLQMHTGLHQSPCRAADKQMLSAEGAGLLCWSPLLVPKPLQTPASCKTADACLEVCMCGKGELPGPQGRQVRGIEQACKALCRPWTLMSSEIHPDKELVTSYVLQCHL